MASLWDSIVDQAGKAVGKAGAAAGLAAQKTKLKTEILMIDREMVSRQQAFGVELYDYVEPLSKHPSFYSSDDTLTVTLQPPLITAQREISALELKRARLQEKINQAAATRAAAFVPATTWQDKIVNAGKSTALAGNEAKLSTEMALLKSEMNHYKQEFGVNLYKILEDLEDTKQWLPTDREIRSIYDNCRRDMEKIKKRKLSKEKELEGLDTGSYAAPAPAPGMAPPAGIPPPPPPPAGSPPVLFSAYGATASPVGGPPQSVSYPQQQQRSPNTVNSFHSPVAGAPNGTTHDPFAAVPPPPMVQQQQQQQPPAPPAVQGQGMFAYPTDPFAPKQQQQQQPQQQQGFGGAAAAPARQQQQLPNNQLNNNSDPFSAMAPTQQQKPHDPFAAPAPPMMQQQQQQPDPFAPVAAPVSSTAPVRKQQQQQQQQQHQPSFFQGSNSSSNYDDPFSGL